MQHERPMKSSRQGHVHAPIRVAECEMITAQATAVSHPVVAQPVVLPPVLPPVLGKSKISRNSEVPGLPGCHSEGEENRRSEEPTGQSPSGAGTWVQPPDPVDGSRRENERKPENPRDGRISARIPPFDAPFAPARSPARVWLKSGFGSARRRAKVFLGKRGQGSPPAA